MAYEASVAAVVLNYRATQDTVACVAALSRSAYLDLRVVVVDNAADGPEHEELLDALRGAGFAVGSGPDSSVRAVASGANLGYAGGNNLGIALAAQWSPDFLWLLNPDIRVQPNTLTRLLQSAARAVDAGAIGPRVVLADTEPAVIWSDGGVVDRESGRTGNRNMGALERSVPGGALRAVDYVYGGAILLRSAAVAEVGPIPTEYFLYFEETDWCHRLADAGWRLLVNTGARAENHAASGGTLPRPHYLYYMTRNKVLFTRRWALPERAAMEDFQTSFLAPWRDRVADADRSWLATFDEIVATALADAASGSTGRSTWVETVPGPTPAADAEPSDSEPSDPEPSDPEPAGAVGAAG